MALRPRLRAALTRAVLLLLLAVWTCIGAGRVICIGIDGHLGVEPPGSLCCDDNSPAPSGEGAPSGDCDDCVDMDLTGAIAVRAGGADSEGIAPPPVRWIPPACVPPSAAVAYLPGAPDGAATSTLPSTSPLLHRGHIVLRC